MSASDPISADRSSPDSPNTTLGTPEEEMLARREIKEREKSRTENLERAREAAQLGAQIRDAYLKNSSLGREDLKKLERLEKLTRRIRSEIGGSDDETTPAKEMPTKIETAIDRIAELSDTMNKGVEKTPRQVISMGLIKNTNELIDIIRFVRTNLQ